MPTARFGLPLIADNQAQKHVTHNEALDLIDAALPGVALSATTATEPASPAEGDCYIVPAGATWGGVTGEALAVFSGGIWHALAPPAGASVFVADEGRRRILTAGHGWRPGSVLGAMDATAGLRCIDAEIDLSAGGVTVAAPGLIPERVVVLGVTSWVVEAITGPANFKVGDGASLDRFGGWIGPSVGASNIGVVGPFATYAPTDVSVTAQDDATAFTGGRVRVSALVIEPGPPPV